MRAGRNRRGNLPALLTGLVGREAEINRTLQLLRGCRLLTLTGPGGIGKTRLALATAERAAGDYAGGAWLVELAALSDASLVVQTVAVALGIAAARARPIRDVVVDALARRPTLLVLDNCEHLLDACAAFCEAALHRCPSLRIVVTSREPLGLSGETVWRVPPLPLPASAELFEVRAVTARAAFELSPSNRAAVEEICRRLDGIPLAIELAAAWVPTLSVQQIAEHLDDRFRLLAGGDRAALPRQQTLRGTLDWSYGLLSEAEQVVFRRLAVFDGGWTVEGAVAVCGFDPVRPRDVLGLLAALVDKSLVLADADGNPARYRLLETTRQYSLELLGASNEAAVTGARHADYYLALAIEAHPRLFGPDQVAWMQRLDQEQDNLRGALRSLVERGAVEDELRMVAATWDYWWMRGLLSEGQRMAERALSRSTGSGTPSRAHALHGAGLLAAVQGDMQHGHTRFAESVALFRALEDTVGLVRVLGDLASTFVFLGDGASAERVAAEALILARQGPDRWALAYAIHSMSQIQLELAHYAATTRLVEEGIPVWRGLGDRRGLAHALLEGALAARHVADPRRGLELARESLHLFDELGETWGMLGALISIAACSVDAGDPELAGRLVGAADGWSQMLGAAPIPSWSKELDHARLAARATMGGELFEAARLSGQDRRIEEMVALASEGIRSDAGGTAARPDGADRLTPREWQVLALLKERYSNAEIAESLVLSVRTVERHLANIYDKLGVSSRREAAALAPLEGHFQER